jgi:hypothetical protein
MFTAQDCIAISKFVKEMLFRKNVTSIRFDRNRVYTRTQCDSIILSQSYTTEQFEYLGKRMMDLVPNVLVDTVSGIVLLTVPHVNVIDNKKERISVQM